MIDIQVRGERGEVVVHGSYAVDWERAQHIDQDAFPYLGSLLPYADAMFNARQIVKLRQELESRQIRELFSEGLIGEIERLCRRAESEPHLYLWFLGD